MLEVLFALLLTLTVITLVGHAIWVVLAFLVRQITGTSAPSRGQCPVCAQHIGSASDCLECGWSRRPGKLAPLRVAIRQLTKLREQGKLDDEAYKTTLAAMQAAAEPTSSSSTPQVFVAAAVDAPKPHQTSEPETTRPPTSAITVASDDEELNESTPTVPEADVCEPAQPVRESIASRAQHYATRRAEAETAVPAEPVAPRKPWSAMLAAFMEEKHIRWGELVGGLLIISCSVALVISFWSEIADSPLQFAVFNGVTAALFGLGLYAAKRWKLPTTSQGLLITAILMVPLNFLALAAFSEGSFGKNWLMFVGEVVSVAGFTALTYFAARVVLPQWSVPVTIGVMAQCGLAFAVRRFVTPETGLEVLYGISIGSLLTLGTVNAWALRDVSNKDSVSDQQANELYKLLGITSFAVCMPLGLMLFKTQAILDVLRHLSPLAFLAGSPLMATGLLLWQKTPVTRWGHSTVGASLAIAGALVFTAGLALAWPQPSTLLPNTLAMTLAFAAIAWKLRIPEAHIPASAGATLGLLLIGHLAWGNIGWTDVTPFDMTTALWSGETGWFLIGPVALFAVIAWVHDSLQRNQEAHIYLFVTGACVSLSVICASWHGFGRAGDPLFTTWLYLIHACLFFACSLKLRAQSVYYVGSALLLAAFVQGFVYGFGIQLQVREPLVAALVTHGLLHAFVHGALLWIRDRSSAKQGDSFAATTYLTEPLSFAAISTSLGAAGLIAGRLFGGFAVPVPGALAAVAVTWCLLAYFLGSRIFHGLFQLAIVAASMCELHEWLVTRDWYGDVSFFHPYRLLAHGILVALLCLGWCVMRMALQHRTRSKRVADSLDGSHDTEATTLPAVSRWHYLVNPPWPGVDRVMSGIVVLVLVATCIYAVVPGVAQELSPRTEFSRTSAQLSLGDSQRLVPAAELFELPGIPHRAAMGPMSWWLTGLACLLCVSMLVERTNAWRLGGLALVAASATLLLAARWDTQVAVASALRWYTAAMFGIGSLGVIFQSHVLRGFGKNFAPTEARRLLSRDAFLLLSSVAVAPLFGMALFVALAALSLEPPSAAPLGLFQWLFGLCVVVASLWLVSRLGTSNIEMSRRGFAHQSTNVLLALAVTPLVAISLYIIGTALVQHPIVGPDPASFFARVGLSVSYAVPLLIIAVSLIGHAMHQRSGALGLAAGGMLNFCVTAAYLLSGIGQLQAVHWIRLGQMNALTSGCFALGWMVYLNIRSPGSGEIAVPGSMPTVHRQHGADMGRTASWNTMAQDLLVTQVGIAAGFASLFLIPTTVGLFWNPTTLFPWAHAAGVWGWTAILAVIGSCVGLETRSRVSPFSLSHVSAGTWCFACALVASLSGLQATAGHPGTWHGYHVLLAASSLAGFVLLTRSFLHDEDVLTFGHASIYLVATACLSLRLYVGDSGGSTWWSLSGLASCVLLAVLLAYGGRKQRFLYAAGLLINLAASIWWIEVGSKWQNSTGISAAFDFFLTNVLALALPVPLWFTIDRLRIAERVNTRAIGFHRVATTLAVVVLFILLSLSIACDWVGEPTNTMAWLTWSTWLAATVGVATCLWDPRATRSVTGLYVIGLASVMVMVDQFNLPHRQLIWTGSLGLAAYSLLTSYLWSRRAGLVQTAKRLRLPMATNEDVEIVFIRNHPWMVGANLVLTSLVVLLGYWVLFEFSQPFMRVAAAQSILAQAVAVGMLCRGEAKSSLRDASLWLGVLGAVALGWSWLSPTDSWLNRTVIAAMMLAVMSGLYGLGAGKVIRRENIWTQAAQRLMIPLALSALGTLAVVLGSEAVIYLSQGSVEIAWWAILSVALTLIGLMAASLLAAIVPGRDPFGLSEQGRTVYVYASEGLLALLFVHIRLTMPWLFTGFFQQFWPLIVMAIAFLGVGLGEWFRRREMLVLAAPLERTGTLLPMLPVIGYWAAPSNVHFSGLMLVVGVLYSVLSSMRRSFGFGILAALSVNGGLWYLLYQSEGWGLFQHPQIWLIPPALCVLVAAYLNREHINSSQMTTVRYLSSTMIYSASTADIFLNGVATAPWLPLVLAGLSIAGILLGILLRVRAFLFLGTAFLVLALFTMIWYAAVDLEYTWIWYVSGIVTGALIIAVFALFEKKRQEILAVVDKLKQWQP